MSFRAWTKVLPLFVLEFLVRGLGPDGTVEINNREWVSFIFNADSSILVAKEKYHEEQKKSEARAEIREERKRQKALEQFLRIQRDYPEVIRPYLKPEESEDDDE